MAEIKANTYYRYMYSIGISHVKSKNSTMDANQI